MRKERLQILADAIRKDGRKAWDLTGYDTCLTTLIIHNPEFNKLGFVPSNATPFHGDIPTYQGHEGLQALCAFFEITGDDGARLTHATTFKPAECDENGHALTSVILARLDALLGVPVNGAA